MPEDTGEMLGDHGKESDTAWQARVEVRLIPDRRLPPEEREMLAVDFGMCDGELTLHCRGPLVFYALHELGANPHHVEAEPRAQQIGVANREALAKWTRWS